MKYLITGLGNRGAEYQNTRHNIGFRILDALAQASNIVFDDKRYGLIAEYTFKGRTLLLLKPSTFMNLSGKAVNYWLKKGNIPIENLLVVVDDISLPLGKIRLRKRGSDGGHNGLQNIIQILGHQNFTRLRFGIGSDFRQGGQVDYVLSKWTPEEETELSPKIRLCMEIIQGFTTAGIERTMNQYNDN